MQFTNEQGGVWFEVVDSLYFENLQPNEMIEQVYTFAPRMNTSIETGLYTQDKYYYTAGFKNSITGMIDRGIWLICAELELQTTVIKDTIYPMQNILMERKIINKSEIDVNAKLITEITELDIIDTTLFLISGLDTIVDTISYKSDISFETQKINMVSYLYNEAGLSDIKLNNVVIKPLGIEILCNAIMNESQVCIYNYMKNISIMTVYDIINTISLLEENEIIFDSIVYLDSLKENEIYEDSIFINYNDFKFGDYTLLNTYIFFDDTIIKEKKYLNEILINCNLGGNTYTLLDTVKFTISLVNTGDFYISPDLNMDLFAYNFQTNTGVINPGDVIKYDFEIPLIDYYNASYDNKITLELNGSSITKEINCTVIPAKLFSSIVCNDTINAGSIINARIINQGGLPTNFTSKLRIIDSYGKMLDVDSIISNVEVLDSTDISLTLPEFINDDTYQIVLITEYNNKTTFSSKTVKINGIMIAGNVYSENDYYFTDTEKIGNIDFSLNFGIDTLFIDYKITSIGEEERINISGINNLRNGQFNNTYLSPNYNGIGIAPKLSLDEEFEKRNFQWVVKMDIDEEGDIYITDDYSDKVFVMDCEGNYLRYIKTGLYWLWDIVVDNEFIYVDNGNQIKCLTKEGDTRWTINSNALILDIKGDTVFITEYGCIGLLDGYTGELIDIWTYDINWIYYGFYDKYYKALIVLTDDKELIKINNNGEIIERNPLNIDIYAGDCEAIYSMNNGTFGILYRDWRSDENKIINYTINRYGEIIQIDEIDEYIHNEWSPYISSVVYKDDILYFIDSNNKTIGAIENNEIIWHKNTLNIWWSDSYSWLQTINGNIYLGEDGKVLEYTNYTLSDISEHSIRYRYYWGAVEFGENIGVINENKIYFFDNNLNIYDSIITDNYINHICNSIDLSKLIICVNSGYPNYINTIFIYNTEKEIIDSFQLPGDYWIDGMDIDAMDRLYIKDFGNNEIMVYDLSGNELYRFATEKYSYGAIFGGNNRVREFIINNYNWRRKAIDVMDIAGNKLIDIPVFDEYDYVPLMEENRGIIVRNDYWQTMKRYKIYHKNTGIWTYLLDTENNDTYFDNITVNKYIPNGTSIEIRFRSGNNSDSINNEIWSNWYNEKKISLNGLRGRFLEIQAQLSTMDSTISPYLQGFEIETNSGKTYFTADTVINDINAEAQYSLNWHTIVPEQTGEYYIKGKIWNKYEQLLYRGEDKFDIIGSDYAILLQTDKDYYKPYENITLNIKIFNLTDIDDNFTFKLYKNDSLYLDTTIFVADSVIINKLFFDEQSFNIKTFLLLEDTLCSKSKKIFIYAPAIMAEIQCDNETYSEDVNADMYVKNIGMHPVSLNINFGDISVIDSLYPDERKIIKQDFYIYSDTLIRGIVSGDIDLEAEKEIKYLRNADINIQCKNKYTPQIIDLPYSFITNTEGNINVELRVIKDNNEIKTINDLLYLNPDKTRRLKNTYTDSIGLGQNSFWGIDIDNDTIYMTDWGNNELCIYDMEMNLITKLTGIIGAAGIDVEDDRIYVTEAYYGSFKIYNKSYELEKTIYGLGYPGDIEVIGDDIYIIDWDNAGIMHYNTDGNYLGYAGKDYFVQPAGIEEYNGRIYISDYGKNKIFVLNYEFELLDSITDSLYSVEGLAIDDFGYMYVGNWDDNTLSVFNINGEFVYKTEPLKACWADAFKVYNNKYYTLAYDDIFIYDFEGNEQLYYLNLELEKGHYLISADISNERKLGKLSHREYEFDVYDGDTVNIDKFIVEADTIRKDGTFPVEFEISNIGAETFSGSYILSLGNICIITDTLIIGVDMTKSIVHNIDIPFEVGEYDAELTIIKDKQNIAYKVLPFTAETDFVFDYVYDNITIMSGEFGKIPYSVRNRGIAYGFDYIKYDLGEFLRDSFNIILDRNGIYNDTLYLDVADDIPSGQYNGYIFTKNERELLLFNVEGLDISITHTLDKDAYRDGENAVFTMYYENNNSFCPTLYSYLRYNDFTDEGLNKVGGYASDLISINDIGISGTGEYISGLFAINDLGHRDSILFNVYSSLLLGNGINGFARYSNNGLYFTDWDTLIGPGFLNIPNGQYYMQYKLNLNQYTTIDSVIIGNKILKEKSDFQMNKDSIKFTVPIDKAGNNLFYSVYSNYGRSILISNKYINRINDTIQVQLDKYLYNAGDTILVNIESEYTGNLEWNISGGMDSDPYGNWQIIDSNITEKIAIPLTSVSGYYIYNYTFLGFDPVKQDTIIVMNSIPFNVKGYELSVKNIHIDKERYYFGERVYADFDIIANRDMLVNIICYFKDENNNYSICYDDNRWVNTGSDIISIQTEGIPYVYGNCELIYKFYLVGLNKNMLMADGQKAFFVNDNSSPQFIVFDLSACTLDITSNDTLFIDYRLNELCKSVHISINGETQTFFDNISGSVVWDLLDDYGNPVAPGEYKIIGKAFDYASNQSLPMYRYVYIIGKGDTMPPVSYIVINAPKYITDSLIFIKGNETEINIISNDEDIDKLYYKINESEWQLYSQGFTLENSGLNEILYYGVDTTGNSELINIDTVYVDNNAPTIDYTVNEPKYNEWISLSTIIEFNAIDNESGMDSITVYYNDSMIITDSNSVSISPNEPSGLKIMDAIAYDNVGNEETLICSLYLDNEKPKCSLFVYGYQYNEFLGKNAIINIAGYDTLSGIKMIYLNTDNNEYTDSNMINYTVYKEGIILLNYYAEDNVLNKGFVYRDTFIGDTTGPITEIVVGGLLIDSQIYISSRDTVSISAIDNLSGVKDIYYSYSGIYEQYRVPFIISGADRLYSLFAYGVDNVSNIGDTIGMEIYLDNTAPFVELCTGEPSYESNNLFVTLNTPIYFNANDEGCGIDKIYYAINGNIFVEYTDTIRLTDTGLYEINYYATDKLNNISETFTKNVFVDNECPYINKMILGNYIMNEDTIITDGLAEIKLYSNDLPINTGSGVKHLINIMDGTINEDMDSIQSISVPYDELLHKLIYYAYDNVNNTSEYDTILFYSDITPPAISINYPYDHSMINIDIDVNISVNDKFINEWKLYLEKISDNEIIDIAKGNNNVENYNAGIINGDSLRSGEYALILEAKDRLGNASIVRLTIVICDYTLQNEITGLHHPEGVYADSMGVYIADTHNKLLKYMKEDADSFISLWEQALFMPNDVWVNVDTIYTSLWRGPKHTSVYEFINNDSLTIINELSELNHPKGLCYGLTGGGEALVIADRNNNRIIGINNNDTIFIIDSLFKPEGIGIDNNGYIYTGINGDGSCCNDTIEVDSLKNVYVLKLDYNGNELMRIGSVYSDKPGYFAYISDVEIDKYNNIWVVDRNNDRIQIFDKQGNLTGIMNNGFNKPEGISVYEYNVYIADRNNNRIAIMGLYNESNAVTVSKTMKLSDKNTMEKLIVNVRKINFYGAIEMQIKGAGKLSIEIFDVCGRKIKTVNKTVNTLKNKTIKIDNLKAGTYFAIIKTETLNEKTSSNHKIIVLK